MAGRVFDPRGDGGRAVRNSLQALAAERRAGVAQAALWQARMTRSGPNGAPLGFPEMSGRL
jgi:hypothetical protein